METSCNSKQLQDELPGFRVLSWQAFPDYFQICLPRSVWLVAIDNKLFVT